MLSVFLLHIIITTGCLLAGFLFYICMARLSGTSSSRPLIVYLITGLVIISVFYQVLILFFPLNFYLKGLLWLMLLTGGFVARKKSLLYLHHLRYRARNCHPLLIALVASAWIMIALISAGPTIMDDTESYHIQIIKWMQAYGTVPGLANLHERFGFNSGWLTLVSVFTPGHSGHNYYSVVNGMVSMWLSTYLFAALWKNFDQKDNPPAGVHPGGIVLILIYTIVCWPLIRGNAANANYDFITTCITIILFLELWRRRTNTPAINELSTELFLWPVFLFTVRITNYPLLLISLFACIQLIREKKKLLLPALILLCIVSVAAFIIRNVIISGYLFYPVYQIDLFSFDWKAGTIDTRQIATFIKYFNRVNAGFMPVEATRQLTGISWIPVWFKYLLYYDKTIIITAIPGFLACGIFLKKMRPMHTTVAIFLLALVLQLVSWFLIAPDTRFAYGPLLAGSYLLTVPFEQQLHSLFTKKIRMVVVILLLVIVPGYSIVKIISNKNYINPFIPVLLPVPAVHITRLNAIDLYIPEKIRGNWNARCYGTDLPCLYEIKPGLRARSHKIQDGFKIEK